MEEAEDEAISSNFRVLRARPELGMGQQTIYLGGLTSTNQATSRAVGDDIAPLPPNQVHLQQRTISVLSHQDGLPRYSTFTGPRLCGRRRPRGKGKTKSKKRKPEGLYRLFWPEEVVEEEERIPQVSTTSSGVLVQEEEEFEELDGEAEGGTESDLELADDSASINIVDAEQLISENSAQDAEARDAMFHIGAVEDSYVFQLLYAQSIMMVDGKTEILVQDFDSEKRSLKVKKFCIVKRTPVKFINAIYWLYSCSCSNALQDFIRGLSNEILQQYDEFRQLFTENYKECVHVQVCRRIVEAWDKLDGFTAADSFEGAALENWNRQELARIVELPFSNESLICVRPPKMEFAVVGMERSGFTCTFCHTGTRSCPHVKCIKSLIENEPEMVPDFVLYILNRHEALRTSFPRTYTRSAVSTEAIPVNVLPSQVDIFNGLLRSTINNAEDDDLKLNYDVYSRSCPSCQSEFEERTIFSERRKKLYTLKNIFEVFVPYVQCRNSECRRIQEFDGCSKGILNMGDFLVAHDVMRDYMHHFLHGHSQSLISYLEIWKLNISSSGYDTNQFLNYQQWRMTWYSFLRLLDIDYASAFQCEECGSYPKVLLCDATTLGFRRHYARPIEIDRTEESRVTRLRGRERVYVNDPIARKLLRKFSKLRQLEDGERVELGELLATNYPVLHNVLVEFEQLYDGNANIPDEVWTLIRCLSSTSPACSYFPVSQTLQSLIQRLSEAMVIRQEPEAFAQLQNCAPIIFGVLKVLPQVPVSQNLIQLFIELTSKAELCFSVEQHTLDYVDGSDERINLSFFPSWPRLCKRGQYFKDRAKASPEEDCTKAYRGHPNLLPGIFTVYCEHEICYGFEVMERQESPNVPFTIVRTRFPTAPDAVIYDNACNLHQYCLNRDPSFFRGSNFLVDRFHWKNHTGCAESYDVSNYRRFSDTNTQINEQRNSTLKVLKSQLSYMNKENFIDHCKLFMWYRNLKTKK